MRRIRMSFVNSLSHSYKSTTHLEAPQFFSLPQRLLAKNRGSLPLTCLTHNELLPFLVHFEAPFKGFVVQG